MKKKSKNLIFTTLLAFAMVFSMMFGIMPNNLKSVYASGDDVPVPTSLTATYTGTILAGNTINPSGISITLTYSDSLTEPVNAGAVEYWYGGEQITNPTTYIFESYMIGNIGITVKYQGLETIMAVEVVGYTITFNVNGGGSGMMPVEHAGQYYLPNCEIVPPANKKFIGWALSSDGEVIDGQFINITADTELFAIWADLENVTITFDAGDGTGTMTPVTILEKSNYQLPECTLTAPQGYTFQGWVVNGNYSVSFAPGFSIEINEDTVITAIWANLAKQSISATYTGTIIAGNTINPQNISITLVYEDSSTGPLSAGAVEYWYDGQQIQDPINYIFDVELIGNLNITIRYEGLETTMAVQIVGYTITFNDNGGTGTMQNIEYAGIYTLPICTFTAPTEKQFKGWSTSANGSVIEGTTINITADTELFAIWEDILQTPTNPENPQTPTNPEQPEETNNGLGVGTIVGIVLASLVVLGTGGFAIVWFVIKKKSWADFVAIFKKK